MPRKKVSIDFEAIFSPYTMAAVLAALHRGEIGEIFVPCTATLIEVWNHPRLPRPITLYLEKDDESVFLGLSNLFGSRVDAVDPRDPFAGLLLLRKALKDGAVTLLDPTKHHREVVDGFAKARVFNDHYRKDTPTGTVNLGPDFGNGTLEGLIGWGLTEGIVPIFGDRNFLVHFANAAESIKLGTLVGRVPQDPTIAKIGSLPGIPSADALYKFSTDRDFGKVATALLATNREEASTDKNQGTAELLLDVAALMVDHGTHTMVAGGATILYKAWKTLFARPQ
jgi:hypothetical protein